MCSREGERPTVSGEEGGGRARDVFHGFLPEEEVVGESDPARPVGLAREGTPRRRLVVPVALPESGDLDRRGAVDDDDAGGGQGAGFEFSVQRDDGEDGGRKPHRTPEDFVAGRGVQKVLKTSTERFVGEKSTPQGRAVDPPSGGGKDRSDKGGESVVEGASGTREFPHHLVGFDHRAARGGVRPGQGAFPRRDSAREDDEWNLRHPCGKARWSQPEVMA